MLGRRLNHTLALVIGRGETSKGLGVLALGVMSILGSLQLGHRLAAVSRTLRYSLEASWYSLDMVRGAGLANMRMVAKMAKDTATPTAVYRATLRPSSGGGMARGPWGPKAIQYAVRGNGQLSEVDTRGPTGPTGAGEAPTPCSAWLSALVASSGATTRSERTRRAPNP